MKLEITGLIHRIEETETTGYNFQNRFFYLRYVDDNGNMQYLKFKLSHGRVELIEGFSVNDKVKVTFALEGNEVKNDKQNLVVYDRKEVYSIQGITETKIDQKNSEITYYELADGEEDEDLIF